ncbi:MAG: chemotaxis protein CheD [Pseudomonadota bacterium]
MVDDGQPGIPSTSSRVIHIGQGEVRAVTDTSICLGTILGSCIATLIWDPEAKVGGLNHLLLPSSTGSDDGKVDHDINLMELLINGVVRAGGARNNLRAKVFGGARMIDGLGTTGAANAQFVDRFLADEGIPCVAKSVGGRYARRLRVWPAIGRVQQLRLRKFDEPDSAPEFLGLRAHALKLSGVELL